jgi:hypothetical protein
VAIKAPESLTDEHALLLAATKCHVMALEKRGQELRKPDAVALLEATLKGEKATGSTLPELRIRIAGFVVQSTPGRSGIGDSPGYPILKDASLCVNLDWLFGHLNSVVWFFG